MCLAQLASQFENDCHPELTENHPVVGPVNSRQIDLRQGALSALRRPGIVDEVRPHVQENALEYSLEFVGVRIGPTTEIRYRLSLSLIHI